MDKKERNKLSSIINNLKKKNAALEAENKELKYIVHDIQATNQCMEEMVSDMRDIIEEGVASECGCVTLTNHTCYQDFIAILINNGYAVEINPIEKRTKLQIVIKEGNEE